jgi:hypothetical protein
MSLYMDMQLAHVVAIIVIMVSFLLMQPTWLRPVEDTRTSEK